MNNMIKAVKALLFACACCAAVAGGAAGGSYYYSQTHEESVQIPSFTGSKVSLVEDWAEKNGLEDSVRYEHEFSEEEEKDIVIAQSIRKGAYLKEGEILKITVSDGKDPDKEFEIIDFTGMKEEEIRKWFQENEFADFSFEYAVSEDDSIEEGMFVSSSPAAGQKAKRSQHVSVTLATKVNETITVGDLNLYSLSTLEAWASEHKLTLNTTWIYDSAAYGTIISFSPGAGTEVRTGDVITAVISAGEKEETAAVTPAAQPASVPAQTAAPAPTPTPAATPVPSTPTSAPETQTPETPTPETESPEPVIIETEEPTPEPGCPVSIVAAMFTNRTADEVIGYYGSANCAWTVISYNDSTTNPNNYAGVAGYTQTSYNTATLTMYVRWQ